MPNLTPGQKIVVRANDSRLEGFVAHAGSFLAYGRGGRSIIYDWCGLGCEFPLERVTVSASAAPFRLY